MRSGPADQETDERLDRALAYIDERLRERPSLAEMARAARMSPAHFDRTFARALGEGAHAYMARRALARAAWTLIHRRGESVTEIAMEFGFSSPSDFSRAFKSAYGASPTGFRSSPPRRAPPGRSPSEEGSSPSENAVEPRVERLPDLDLAFVRVLGLSRERRSERIEGAFARLYACLKRRGAAVEGGLVLGLTMDPPETLAFDRCRYYACIEAIPGADLGGEASTARFPTAGEYACADVPAGAGGVAARFFGTCSFLLDSWMPSRGLEPDDRPQIEVFSAEGQACWRILAPVARKAGFA